MKKLFGLFASTILFAAFLVISCSQPAGGNGPSDKDSGGGGTFKPITVHFYTAADTPAPVSPSTITVSTDEDVENMLGSFPMTGTDGKQYNVAITGPSDTGFYKDANLTQQLTVMEMNSLENFGSTVYVKLMEVAHP